MRMKRRRLVGESDRLEICAEAQDNTEILDCKSAVQNDGMWAQGKEETPSHCE